METKITEKTMGTLDEIIWSIQEKRADVNKPVFNESQGVVLGDEHIEALCLMRLYFISKKRPKDFTCFKNMLEIK